MSKTIMLIHGAWLNAHSWEGFKARYEARGYTVIAPSWPYDERPPPELRASPHPDLRNVGYQRILDHSYREIRALRIYEGASDVQTMGAVASWLR